MTPPADPEEAIVEAALALPLTERPAYLDRVCAGKPDLRQTIEALLRAHELALRTSDSKSSSLRQAETES
jgi:hypothetical protein